MSSPHRLLPIVLHATCNESNIPNDSKGQKHSEGMIDVLLRAVRICSSTMNGA